MINIPFGPILKLNLNLTNGKFLWMLVKRKSAYNITPK